MPGCRPVIAVLAGALLLAGGPAAPAAHAARPTTQQTAPAAVAPRALPGMLPPPELADASSYVLMDATTGTIIAEKAPGLAWPPASLAKLMTAYLTYQKIAAGSLKPDQVVPVSAAAWHTGGSRMFISPGADVTVDQLLHGLLIESGNDASVALAQAIAGSRSAFVGMMNAAAARLGLSGTHYANVNGLPHPGMTTTARDIATLSRALLRQYPQILKISAEKYYTFDKIRQRSWNPVLFRDPTVDGLKTGLTDAAGHCIDATALRDGRRLIAVVFGEPNWTAGTKAIEALLDYGYQFATNTTVARAGRPIGSLTDARWKPETIPVGAAHDVEKTLPAAATSALRTHLSLNPPGTPGRRQRRGRRPTDRERQRHHGRHHPRDRPRRIPTRQPGDAADAPGAEDAVARPGGAAPWTPAKG